MRLNILAVGKAKPGPETELFSQYVDWAGKTGRNLGLSEIRLTEVAVSQARDATSRKAAEAKAVAATIPSGSEVVVLDEAGKDFTTKALASWLGEQIDDRSLQHLYFVIGGPDGLDEDFRDHASKVIRFGSMTWPHQLVRVMLAEQLYRCLSVLAGHPYHRD